MNRFLQNSRQGFSGRQAVRPTQLAGQPSHGSALTIFATSIANFQDALSQHDQKQFRQFENVPTMMRDLEAHCKKLEGGKKLLATCKVIERFAKTWSPFFDIIGIFVSSHPEYAAFAWGAIRLVFLLSSNFTGFFQKLAEMLERMMLRLPNYSEHLDLLRKRMPFKARTRLMEAFSFVYADILQFLQDACAIFTNKKGGNRHRINVVRDLFWTPFDVRFSGLLERLREHQELVDIELRIERQKALDESLDNMYKTINGVQIQLQQHAVSVESKLKEREGLKNRLREIRQWIASPEYMDEFEKAKKMRFPQTGQWVLRDPKYRQWKRLATFTEAIGRDDTSHRIDWAQRTLKLEAGPGFGKTILSAYLIDDLQFHSRDQGQGRNVVFFHFDSRRPEKERVFSAIRALATQLIHKNQHATKVVDAASLLMDVTGSGQPHASDEEVLEIFTLLANHLMGMIVVLDGIDECNDAKGLFTVLRDILGDTSCKVFLLGRPNVKFPAAYAKVQSINPKIYSNLDDIKLYLNYEVDELLTTVTVAGEHSATQIARMIAERSRSMFLFARLMMEYLHSPALTPHQRLVVINSLTTLEGLSTMYGRVAQKLMQRYANEQAVIKTIFQLIAAVKRPLTLEEIRTALSIKIGQATSPDPMDKLENLENTIIPMCGGLVEIADDGKLQFIHASVKEFLTQETQQYLSRNFFIDMAKAHFMVARMCLSYLVCDMPSGPLSGSAEELAEPDVLQARLPLLCYIAMSWAHHLAQGVKFGEGQSLTELLEDFSDLAKLFSRFLLSKTRVTAWIEASWTFGNAPNFHDSLAMLSRLEEEQSNIDSSPSNLVPIYKELGKLSHDLDKLAADWTHLLSKKPNEIWGASVSAFNRSDFWVNTTSTIVKSFFDEHLVLKPRVVLRASKLSIDGQRVGLIEVLDESPIVQTDLALSASGNEEASSGSVLWSIRYQVSTIEGSAQSLVDIRLPVSQDDLQHIVKPNLLEDSPDSEFQFPMAFSADLQEVAVLHTIVRPHRNLVAPSREAIQSFDHQIIDLSPKGISTLERPYQEAPYPAWYRIWVTQTRYLAVTKRRGRPEIVEHNPWGVWSLTIWEDESQVGQGPSYQPFGEIYLNTTNLAKDGFLAFHPTLPLVVASGDIETVCWNFKSKKYRHKRTIHHAPLLDIRFSLDGNYINAQSFNMGQTCIIDMHPFIDDDAYEISYWTVDSKLAGPSQPSESSSYNLALFGGSNLPSFFASLSKSSTPAIQCINDFAARTSQDTIEASALRRFPHSGAITRMTIKPGRNRVETLAYLPETATDQAVSLLDPFSESDNLKLVIVNEPKESYKYGHAESLILPKIVERERASIASYNIEKPQRIPTCNYLMPSVDGSSDPIADPREVLDNMWNMEPGTMLPAWRTRVEEIKSAPDPDPCPDIEMTEIDDSTSELQYYSDGTPYYSDDTP